MRANEKGYGCTVRYLAFSDRHGVLLQPRAAPAPLSAVQARIAATLAALARDGVPATRYRRTLRRVRRQQVLTRDDLLACCSALAERWAREPQLAAAGQDMPATPTALQASLRYAWSQRSAPL